jgi:molecular chaperone GrpE (heat shock protein)
MSEKVELADKTNEYLAEKITQLEKEVKELKEHYKTLETEFLLLENSTNDTQLITWGWIAKNIKEPLLDAIKLLNFTSIMIVFIVLYLVFLRFYPT